MFVAVFCTLSKHYVFISSLSLRLLPCLHLQIKVVVVVVVVVVDDDDDDDSLMMLNTNEVALII